MEVSNVGCGSDDSLAIKLEHDTQCGMGRRVLGSKIEDPSIASIGVILEVFDVVGVDIPRFGW